MNPNPTADFSTCDLCDAHKASLVGPADAGFRVLPPVLRDFGGVPKFAGPVTTVKCFEDNTHVKAAVRCWAATWPRRRRRTAGPA